jgi:hypothetical protein
VGNRSDDTWGYVIAIICLAVIFVIAIPVLGFMYMDMKTERMLMESNVRKIEKLKKEFELEKERKNEKE